MNKPDVKDTISGYIYEWEKEKVKIEVSKLHNHTSDGRVTGEMAVSTSAFGSDGHLHQAQFNFSSSQSRKQLCSILAERYKDPDWYAIIEQACVYTLERQSKGEPVISLFSGENCIPPEFLIDPLIVKYQPNTIFGQPGSAKSTLAIALSQFILFPEWENNPFGFIPTKKSVNTLMLDWETDEQTVKWQLNMLAKGTGKEPLHLKYRHCALPLVQDVEQIRKHIVDTETELVIIDSLGLACGGELNEAAPALAFFTAFRQLKTTGLILAHTSKDTLSKKKSIYGSVYFEAGMRNIWEIQKHQEKDSSEMDIRLTNRKPPPFRKLHKDIGLRFIYPDNNAVKIEQGDLSKVPEFVDNMDNGQKILAALRNSPNRKLNLKDLSENTGISEAVCRVMFGRLKKYIAKQGDNYCLISNEYGDDE